MQSIHPPVPLECLRGLLDYNRSCVNPVDPRNIRAATAAIVAVSDRAFV